MPADALPTPDGNGRRVKPLPVQLVVAEPIDFDAWADQYAAIVIRLHQQDHANQKAA